MRTLLLALCALALAACGEPKFKTWPAEPVPKMKAPIQAKPPPVPKPRPVTRAQPKAVPKAAPKVVISAAECAELADGIRLAGAKRVREEAAKRNVPQWKINAAFRQCGY